MIVKVDPKSTLVVYKRSRNKCEGPVEEAPNKLEGSDESPNADDRFESVEPKDRRGELIVVEAIMRQRINGSRREFSCF